MADTRAGIAPQVDTYANWVSANPTLGKDDTGDSFNQIIFATASPVGDLLIWGNDQTFTVSFAADQFVIIGKHVETYNTGWLLNEIGGAGVGKWDNVHLGDVPTGDDNVTHGLATNLSDLIVKLFVSTDGTDNNSFEVGTDNYSDDTSGALHMGYNVFQVDTNNVTVQTGVTGLSYNDASGANVIIDTEDWYYKIKVYKLT